MQGFLRFFSFLMLLALSVSSFATQITNDNYDIYIGDLNNDGAHDFYFHGRPLTLILHGDIATPLVIAPANFAVLASGGTYATPQLLTVSSVDIAARLASGALRRATLNTDYFLWNNGDSAQSFVLLRGLISSSASVLLTSFSNTTLPLISNTYNTIDVPDISNPTVSLTVEDVNNDGRADILLGTAFSAQGQIAYLADANGVPVLNQKMIITPTATPPATNGSFVGSVAGEFRVNESGAATYNVAIKMPDGVAGVKPQINIGYSSQAGNGPLGKGWNIGGLGSISRCRQTLSQDGVAKPLTWSGDDRFCLDGQRLTLTSGIYGSPNSVYKTELDTFVTVTLMGGTAGHPDYFVVVAKDGSKSTYGGVGTVGSELTTPSGVMTWSISKFEDSVGNPINFIYEGGLINFRVKEIYYAYGLSKSLESYNAKIVFTYDAREDWTSGYVNGHQIQTTQRLKKVTSYNGSNVLREYTLGYDYAPADTGSYSRVISVRECADTAGVSCFPATTFSWYSDSNSTQFWQNTKTSLAISGNATNVVNYTFLDINGNGILDYVWSESTSSGSRLFYSLDTASGIGTSKELAWFGSASFVKFQPIDYNGDARQDVMIYNANTKKWSLYLSTRDSTGWSLQHQSDTVLPFIKADISVGDVNSDGLADVMVVNSTSKLVSLYHLARSGAAVTSPKYYSFAAPITYGIAAADADSYSNIDFPNGSLNTKSVVYADFNGDGRVDIGLNRYGDTDNGRWSDYSIYVASSENQFKHYFTVASASADRVLNPDINGDGLSDLVYKRSDTRRWYSRINTGKGFSGETLLPEITGNLDSTGEQEPAAADINRDGYADIVWRASKEGVYSKVVYVKYWNPKTSAFIAAQVLETPGNSDNSLNYVYLDADGDTWIDRVTLGLSFGDTTVKLSVAKSDSRFDLIETITDGLGNTTSIGHEPLSKSPNYVPIGDIKITASTREVCNAVYSAYDPYASPPITQIGTTCSTVPTDLINTDEFYRQINAPFAGLTNNNVTDTPVLEAIGAMPIVTKVSSSAFGVADKTNGSYSGTPGPRATQVDYFYKQLRMQAAGRGLLGFASLKTVDKQTGITSETTYRQDWPYVGSPIESTTKTSDGKLLSQATNTWNRKTFSTMPNQRYQPYIQQTIERSYGLNTDGTVTSDPLQTVTTYTQMADDEYGNVAKITATTEGGGQTFVKETSNLYFTGTWEAQMGRLERSTVTSKRNGVTADSSRMVRFEYFTTGVQKGLLSKEMVEEGTVNALTTDYLYDAFGNKKQVSVTGKATSSANATRKTIYQYDPIGRYVTATENNLGHSSSVTRDPITGAPIQVKDTNGVTADVHYDKMGTEYLRIDSTGAWSRTDIAFCGTNTDVAVQCPTGAKFYQLKRVAGGRIGVEYLDGHGRVLRSSTVGFDGRWAHTDSQYDVLGRLKHQSTPYFQGTTPATWSEVTYDIIGRVTSTRSAGTGTTTSSYTGYETTIKNQLNQIRTETRNGLGQLIGVRDHLGGTVAYTYNIKGDLLTATTDDAPNASPNVAPVTVTMCYDLLGRKTRMHDPDKGGFKTTGAVECSSTSTGWWNYKYNAFGELIEQSGPDGRSTMMTYDALGRMVTRKDFIAGTLDGNTAWFYDAPLGGAVTAQTKGKLTAVIMNKVNSTITNSQASCGGTNHCTQTQYDSKSRPEITFTHLPDGSDHIVSVSYDRLGRAYQQRDALQSVFADSGVQTQYNLYGYAYRTLDLAPRDGSNGVLSTVLEMNARGQVTREVRGNGAVTVNTYDPITGLLKKQQATVTGLRDVQNNSYDWDAIGNLKYRITAGGMIGSYNLKAKEEGFCYDGLNRLVATLPSRTPTCGGEADVTYDGLGNITSKKGVGAYLYDRINGGAHAVTSVNGAAYRYDGNGNVISGDGRSFEYTSYDMVSKISKSADHYAQFSYGADRARWQRVDKKGLVETTTTYLGNVERIVSSSEPSVAVWKRTVGGAVHTYKTINNVLQANGSDKKYLYTDHLGSVDVITDGVGKITHSMSFDPWGARRSGEDWSAQTINQVIASLSLTGFTQPITTRGYTGHEMVDEMGIIHMNGRIYDARIARFLQADPFIQASENTQSFNRYSYVLNNPLNATDPSGFFFSKIWKALKPFVGAIVTVALISTGVFAPLAGMIGGAIGAAANGGNILQGAVFGAFSGAAGGITNAFTRAIAMGMIGGVQSVAAGGKFGHGFLAAGIGGLGGGGAPSVEGFIKAAVLGGMATAITGGKFANGAAGAAFMFAVSTGIGKIKAGGVSQTNDGDGAGRTKEQLQIDKLKFEAELLQLRKDGKLSVDVGIYNSPDAAATAVLNETAALSEKYQLEVAGSIYKQGNKWAYSAPKVGGYGSAPLTTDMIGYHTHPDGPLEFSNRENNHSNSGSGDAGWVATSQKTLYLGVKTESRVAIGACDYGKCSEWVVGRGATQPSRVLQ